MKVVLQRVTQGSVWVEGAEDGTRSIDRGFVLLIGYGHGDTSAILPAAVDKILGLRVFPDEKGRFHHSLVDINGDLLLVSQFTLYADTNSGRRPSFSGSLAPQPASDLFLETVQLFTEKAPGKVATGEFGAYMKVQLENDGPVTLLLDF